MLIPIAKHRPTGRLVGPLQVARGVACDCLCLECGLPLIAKQGPVVSWHFSHTGNGTEETGSCGEGSIHKAAKAVLQSSRGRWMKLPKRIPEQPLLRIAQAQQEFRLTDIGRRVDLLITYDAKRIREGSKVTNVVEAIKPWHVGVEINVSHPKDSGFIADLERTNQYCIEIDIPLDELWTRVNHRLEVHAALRGMLLNSSNDRSRWLWPPVN